MKNKILFLSATHGDEGFSVDVLNKLEKNFPKEEYGYDWIIANERAYEKNTRYTDADLNRSAPGVSTSPLYEVKRAAEIIELAKQYDVIIDIHGTETPFGIVTIIPLPTLDNLLLSTFFAIKRNVIWYSKNSLKKGPLAQFVGKPSIEIECGPKNDPSIQSELYQTLATFLTNTHNFGFKSISQQVKTKEYFQVYGKVEESDKKVNDFEEIEINGESCYPFLSQNGYKNISFYKMKKINFPEIFIY